MGVYAWNKYLIYIDMLFYSSTSIYYIFSNFLYLERTANLPTAN